MKIYRIAKQIHLTDITGEGARLFGGRWNKRGYNMLYTSEHLSLSVLELLVHLDYQFISKDFGFIEIELPKNTIIAKAKPHILNQDWRHNPALSFTQDYGTDWLISQKKLALKVPSAVLPNESNILINPNHKQFSEVKIIRKSILDIDSRVF